MGVFGELHPNIALKMGLKNCPIIFSIFPEVVSGIKVKKRKSGLENSDYPAVVRDFAFVVENKLEVHKLINTIRNIDRELIRKVNLFDVFEGSEASQQVGVGKKSLAFEILIQPKDRTLEDKEIELLCEKIVFEVGRVSGGILR